MTAIYSVAGGIIDNRRFTKQREYMATKKTQRVAIFVIMIVLVVGTLGSFAVMVLAQQEQSKNAAALQKAQAKYETEQKAHQAKVDAQAAELSKQYYPVFSPYFDRVGKFDIDGVKELSTEDLLVGKKLPALPHLLTILWAGTRMAINSPVVITLTLKKAL